MSKADEYAAATDGEKMRLLREIALDMYAASFVGANRFRAVVVVDLRKGRRRFRVRVYEDQAAYAMAGGHCLELKGFDEVGAGAK